MHNHEILRDFCCITGCNSGMCEYNVQHLGELKWHCWAWEVGFMSHTWTGIARLFESRFNIKMLCYQYRKSHCGDKTIVRSSYLHNGFPTLVRWHLYIESGTWCLCAFFSILSQFYVPFYMKKRKLDNFMCLLAFECAKRLKAHSQAIPACTLTVL